MVFEVEGTTSVNWKLVNVEIPKSIMFRYRLNLSDNSYFRKHGGPKVKNKKDLETSLS